MFIVKLSWNDHTVQVFLQHQQPSGNSLQVLLGCGRGADCAVVGQNAEPEARAELRQPRTRLIGSVAYFPEKYGDGLIHLALDILARKPTPPAVFIKHQLVTAENVDHLYPNDHLLGAAYAIS